MATYTKNEEEFLKSSAKVNELNESIANMQTVMSQLNSSMQTATGEQRLMYEKELEYLEKAKNVKQQLLDKEQTRLDVSKEYLKLIDNTTEAEVNRKEAIEDATKAAEEQEKQRKKDRAKRDREIRSLGGKISKAISGLGDMVSTIIVGEMQRAQADWAANQEIMIKNLETHSQIFKSKISQFGKNVSGVLTSTFTSITKGIQEGAYAAANASTEMSISNYGMLMDIQYKKLLLENYRKVRLERAELDKLKITEQEVNSSIKGVGSLVEMIPLVGDVLGGVVSGIAQSIAGNIYKAQIAHSEIEIEKLKLENELAQKQLEAINDQKKESMQIAGDIAKTVTSFGQEIENVVLKTDEMARSMANALGMTGRQIASYEKFVFNAAKNLRFRADDGSMVYLNKSPEDMAKMQSGYIDSSGRNIVMSQGEMVEAFKLGTVLGDDNLAASLLGDMDYFNHTIEDSTQMIWNMFQTANKAGVSNRKFAKDLQTNLKMAQKYTFRGGTENLMKMAIWSQKTRFNLQNLESFVDKIQTGGLEDLISTSARLQVLGGRFAMNSDPLGMMFDAWSDPEAMAKRLHDMTKGFGNFNTKTGEAEINGLDAMRLRAYAEAAGLDYTSVRQEVTQRVKNEQIDKYLKNKNLTDEQKQLLYSKAQYNTKTGTWQVSLDNGKRIADINDNLSESDWTQLMPVEESINEHVKGIYDLLNQQDSAQKYMSQRLAADEYEDVKQQVETRIQNNLTWLDENEGTIVGMLKKSNQFVTEQDALMKERFVKISGVVDEAFNAVKLNTELTTKTWADTASAFRVGLKTVLENLGNLLNGTNNHYWEDRLSYAVEGKSEYDYEIDRRLKILKHANEKIAEYQSKQDKMHDEAKLDQMQNDISHGFGMRDGFISANGSPIISAGSRVTPIKDGSVSFAKSHPQDTALFAKEGGPVWSMLGEILDGVRGKGSVNGGTMKLDVSGRIDLDSIGSIDLNELARKNPSFIDGLTVLIASSMLKKKQGGRGKNDFTQSWVI